MSLVVIINPVAGTANSDDAARSRSRLAKKTLEAAGIDAEVRVTERPGHACEIARDAVARGVSLVVAWGGDGTVNEVGRSLIFSSTSLGIVPAGSGNGLARYLRIASNPAEALLGAVRGHDRSIDAGEIGGRPFFNIAGIGFDASVARRRRIHRGGWRGLWDYAVAVVREFRAFEPEECTITTDTDTGIARCRAFIMAFANSGQYGYGALVAPSARVDDGVLDLVVIEPATVAGNLWRLVRLFTGTFDRARGVRAAKMREAMVEAAHPMLFHTDGEPAEGGRALAVRVHPRALRIRVADV